MTPPAAGLRTLFAQFEAAFGQPACLAPLRQALAQAGAADEALVAAHERRTAISIEAALGGDPAAEELAVLQAIVQCLADYRGGADEALNELLQVVELRAQEATAGERHNPF